MKRMSVKEFRELGLLQEVNRRVLHPLGLALEVVIDKDTGEESFGDIWDCRDDPEGMVYDELDLEKARNVSYMQAVAFTVRMQRLGFVIQPVNYRRKK